MAQCLTSLPKTNGFQVWFQALPYDFSVMKNFYSTIFTDWMCLCFSVL